MARRRGSCSVPGCSWIVAAALSLASALGAQTPTLVHTFDGTDGSAPNVAMVRGPDGLLYGITLSGGTGSCSSQCGTVYQLDPAGGFLTIYNFPQSADDAFRPLDQLSLGGDGLLYGSTLLGGTAPANFGTVYSIDTSGTLSVLHEFDIDANDGWDPIGGVVRAADGTLYGTTNNGGTSADPHCSGTGCGTLFSLVSPTFTPLHQFDWSDGANVGKSLVFGADGNLYGAAVHGGLTAPLCTGCGTVFRFNLAGPSAGSLDTLHAFTSGADGWSPSSSLFKAGDGTLYGTTSAGGDTTNCGIGCGTVYKVDGSGTFSTVHAFLATDGRDPEGGVIQATDGDFYGTTRNGGTGDFGTIYEMDSAGNVTTLYSFDGSVGQYPVAGLVQASDGNLYGTAGFGANQMGVLYRLAHQCYHDVATNNPFYPFICKVGVNQITGGCGGGNYCPGNPVTRAQMAVFLLKAIHGEGYAPPPCAGIFGDVPCPGGFAADWIEELYAESVTGGCQASPLLYCPGNPVTRAQMAVFLLKAEHGSVYAPPACAGIFGDVACPSPFADWIEQLYAEQVTGGCQASPLLYCPGNPNTRGQMAVFLVKTFGLP